MQSVSKQSAAYDIDDMLEPSPQTLSSPKIPRLIHQTFPDKQKLPLDIQENINKIKKMNPSWEYRIYDDHDIDQYIKEHCAWARPYIDKLSPDYGPAKADFFRYLLIYQEGGVYLDIKSTLEKPLDEVIDCDDEYLLSHWSNCEDEQGFGWGLHGLGRPGWTQRGEFQQWHIVAKPKHPFLKAVLDRVCHNIENYCPYRDRVGKQGVLRVTGPIAYTDAILPLLDAEDAEHQYRFIEAKPDCGLVYSYYTDPHQHEKRVFAGHYSTKKAPVVQMSHSQRAMSWLHYRIKRGVYSLKKRYCRLTGQCTEQLSLHKW